jgi:hypothetical protein
MADFMKQNSPNSRITTKLPLRQKFPGQFSHDLVGDEFNPSRLTVPRRM